MNDEKSEQDIFEAIKSMVEIGYEFVNRSTQIEALYILCSTTEGLYFNCFYNIEGNIAKRHQVNTHLIEPCDLSASRQISANEIGLQELEKIVAVFKAKNSEIPALLKVTFTPGNGKFESEFGYEDKLSKTDLMEGDLVDIWVEELKNNLKA